MDQLANQAAKVHYMSGGKLRVPLVLRTTLGRHAPLGRAAQPEPARLGQPRPGPQGRAAVDARTTPKGLLKAAIRDDNPVVFFEDKLGLRAARPGARGRVRDPARRRRRQARRDRHHDRGARAAWSTWRSRPPSCSRRMGISAEVVDPRTIVAARRRDADRLRAQDRPRASWSTRGTRATACRPSSRR